MNAMTNHHCRRLRCIYARSVHHRRTHTFGTKCPSAGNIGRNHRIRKFECDERLFSQLFRSDVMSNCEVTSQKSIAYNAATQTLHKKKVKRTDISGLCAPLGVKTRQKHQKESLRCRSIPNVLKKETIVKKPWTR